MCGIVGYVGGRQAYPILIKGLTRLEYRGYDSAGVALIGDSGNLVIYKTKGKVKDLEAATAGKDVSGSIGIAHTRWATHGEPSDVNSHPHYSENHNLALIHNGIIENYQSLKTELSRQGYHFQSQTDTEVVIQLIQYMMDSRKASFEEAVPMALNHVVGAYALVIMDRNQPDKLIAARKGSPLIIGVGEDEFFVGSDASPIIEYTHKVVYLGEEQIAYIQRGQELRITDLRSVEQTAEVRELELSLSEIEKGGFPHFMLKEIFEQPRTLRASMQGRLHPELGEVKLSGVIDNRERLLAAERFVICACGTSWHAGLIGKYIIEELTRKPVEVEYASEFRYRRPVIFPTDVVIAISQSGETADTLAAIREAKGRGIKTMGIVNVVGSTIARESDHVMYTMAGPEIAVATTKAYSAQLIAMYLFAIKLAFVKGCIDKKRHDELLEEIATLPSKIERSLEDKERLQWFTAKFSNVHDVFFIGRGIDYAISLEGSLKMKEISYVHSGAYAAGELKHGTISLVEDGTLIIGVLTQSDLYEKTVSNMVEVKSRGAYLCGITNSGNYEIEDTADFTVYIPKTDELFEASLAVIPLQLMGYYMSVARGLDVDKPRNLAKSVTVE